MESVNFSENSKNSRNLISLDIKLDSMPSEIGKSLQRIERIIFENDTLLVSSFDYLLALLKSSSSLSGYKLLDSYISLLYSSELSNSYNLVFCFFTQLEGDSEFLYFEAEMNTVFKYLTSENPKIFSLICYRIVDKYEDAENLKYLAISALNSDEKYKGFQLFKLNTAKYIKDDNLINPENYVVNCEIANEENSVRKAVLTMTIDSFTKKSFLGHIAFKSENHLTRAWNNQIELDIEIFPELNEFSKNFKIKDTKKFFDNKSSDSLLEFIEKKISTSNSLRKYNLEKRMYINSVQKSENSQNNNDFIIEFYKKSSSKDFLFFHVKINSLSQNYKLCDIKAFNMSKVELITNKEKEIVKEALLTLDEDYQLINLHSFNKLVQLSTFCTELFSCYLTIKNMSKNREDKGFLLFYKRPNSIATASSFVEDTESSQNLDGLKLFDETNYLYGHNSIIISDYSVISSSKDIQDAIKFINEKNLLKDVYFKKELKDLISAIELTFNHSKGTIQMIIIFLTLNKDKKCYLYKIKLDCTMENSKIAFKFIHEDKLPLVYSKKYQINETEFQNIIEQYLHGQNWDLLKSAVCTDIVSSYSYYNNKLFIKTHKAIKFRYMKENNLKYGLLTYSEEGLEINPVNFYEMKNEDEYIDYSLINVNKEIYEFKGNYLLDIKFNNVLNPLPDGKGDFNIIRFPQSKSSNNLTENLNELVKLRLKEKFKSIEFQNNTNVQLLFNYLKFYENSVQELVSYLCFKIKIDEIIICELTQTVNDYVNIQFEMKSLSCFLLKPLEEKEYPSFQEISNVLWANTYNNDYQKIIITRVRRYQTKIEKSYFKCVYYIEFKHFDSITNYSFMYGITSSEEMIWLKEIEWVGNI